MPYQSVRFSHHSRLLPTLLSLLTNRVFWVVISFFTNLAGFILVCSSAFLVDQFGRELKWSILTVFLVGIYIVPTLLFCTLLWGHQIKNKFQNQLLLRVVLIYFCFIVVSVASHLNKYPRFHIKVEDEDSNSRKVFNLLSSGAFALTALGLSRAIDLQFEVGFFFYFLEDAMEVSLGIVGKNGYKNWGYILTTAIFCFLLIFLRCYLELIHERHSSNATSQRRTQPPDASTSTTNESMANGDIEASQSRTTQVKANTNSNPTEASQSRIQIYSRASTVNEGSGQIETSSREESWLIDEDQWEIISPRVDMETSISSGESEDDEDVPPPRSTRSREVKEDEDSTQLASSQPSSSDEGTSGVGVGVDGDFNSKTTGSEDPGQEIVEQGDMRSPTPRVDMETSISSGESEDDEDVPPPRSTRSRMVKEDEDSTELASSKPSSFDEGTSGGGVGVGVDGDFNSRTKGSEDRGQEIVEQGDMRSPTPSVDMEKTISSDSGGYEKDDVSLLVPKIEGSVDQGQESGSQDSEKDDNTHLGLATSKPSSSHDEESGHHESHDHQSDCEELRDDTGEIAGGSADSEKVDVPLLPKIDIIEGESRVVNTELGEREPKPQSRSPIFIITSSMSSQMSWDMHLSNLRLDDSYLRSCRFCKLSLAPGHDIYMYRGDMAFCSLKCREKQMARDERKEHQRKEECKLACKKEAHCQSLPTSMSTSNILY